MSTFFALFTPDPCLETPPVCKQNFKLHFVQLRLILDKCVWNDTQDFEVEYLN